MPRPEKPVNAADGPVAAFAVQLRTVRRDAGLTYRQMSKRVHYSVPTLSSAAAGSELPSWEVAWAYVSSCGVPDDQKDVWLRQWFDAQVSKDQPAGATQAAASLGQSRSPRNLNTPAGSQLDHPARPLAASQQRDDTKGPVVEFCARLRELQQRSGLHRAELARRLHYSRTQLYQVLDGEIRRPPDWERMVEPLVRACTGNDMGAVNEWRQQHGALVRIHDELRRRDRSNSVLNPATRTARTVPAQLPADVDVFTGRTAELVELDRVLGDALNHPATAVVISAVSGTAGVGKTALALHWAHRVRGEFPDGQLYVNLRGYDPDQPMTAEDALAGFLRALGVAGSDIPLEVHERAAAYRSLLDGRRMLVVLDDARSAEQIRHLLPGTRSCLVVVTSRDSLAGLVARHGARRLRLDLLPPGDAVALLGALIGGRVDADPDAAWALAEQCARLPLALRLAAELAAARPASSLTALVAELGDEQRRLDLLDAGGDPSTAIRAVFSWSYQYLPVYAARAFRLLGTYPGPDLGPYSVAALTDTNLEQVQHLLDLLARTHLVQLTRLGRYGMHDLLRAYATGLANTEDSDQERRNALTRLFDHYLATAAMAMDILHPAERHRRPRITPPITPMPPMSDPDAAQEWLDAELNTLAATCAHTATHGWPNHTTRIAATLFHYLNIGGHHHDALTIHTHALHAARQVQDPAASARALNDLGVVYQRQGRYEQAVDHHQQALALFRQINDRTGEAVALGNLGVVYQRQGRYEQAVDHHQQALALFRQINDRTGEAVALGNLGVVYQRQGRYEQAVDHHQQALALFRQIGHSAGEAEILNGIGDTHRATGQLREALTYHTASLNLATQIGDRYEQARAHHGLAHIHHTTGDSEQARHRWRQALILYTDLDVPEADEVRARLTALDQVADDTGDPQLLDRGQLPAEPVAADRHHPEVHHID